MPASVAINGGTFTNAIQNPCHIPIARPMSIIIMNAITKFMFLSRTTPPTAPTKHTTEPTARSMLPPVRIQSSIPVARTKTYAFWDKRLFMF